MLPSKELKLFDFFNIFITSISLTSMRAKEEQMDTFGKSPCVSDISTENKSQIQFQERCQQRLKLSSD